MTSPPTPLLEWEGSCESEASYLWFDNIKCKILPSPCRRRWANRRFGRMRREDKMYTLSSSWHPPYRGNRKKNLSFRSVFQRYSHDESQIFYVQPLWVVIYLGFLTTGSTRSYWYSTPSGFLMVFSIPEVLHYNSPECNSGGRLKYIGEGGQIEDLVGRG